MPINLGIKEQKRKHPGQNKGIAYYKEQMWAAWEEIKGEPAV